MCSSSEVSFLQIWAILRPLRSTHHEIPLSFLAILRVLTPDTMRRELRNPIFPVRTWVMIVRSGLDFATPGPSMPAAPCVGYVLNLFIRIPEAGAGLDMSARSLDGVN
ncbi:hypothetical protein CIHG_08567 [Coccidioides immitis H538.4]|uniref:Uncharacterized protein n=1 Tax=Coccidioides immitis H538.4 TaxID=396776 RepID=A0A0J8S251_COCIT|nr:hypothetical protein CIHG_08567 [Coccidioides immitis H538.4]